MDSKGTPLPTEWISPLNYGVELNGSFPQPAGPAQAGRQGQGRGRLQRTSQSQLLVQATCQKITKFKKLLPYL